MASEQKTVSAEKIVLKDTLNHRGMPLLTYRIEYPELSSSRFRTSLSMVNRYYKDKALNYQKYCETELMKQAVEQFRGDIRNRYPVRAFEAVLSCRVTLLDGCIVSVCCDRYEYTGGAHGTTVRESQTWNLQWGGMLKLGQLIRCTRNVKGFVLAAVEEQIGKDPGSYFKDAGKLAAEAFRENNFYCTPRGITVYFQPVEIAPYAGGIREFLLPYSDCVLDPRETCRLWRQGGPPLRRRPPDPPAPPKEKP